MPAYTAAEKRHWSFQPITVTPAPAFTAPADKAWAANPIDAFIMKSLEEKGLELSPEADRRTLLRRLTVDIHGLPPTLEELDNFATDAKPRAYEHLVDQLLAHARADELHGVIGNNEICGLQFHCHDVIGDKSHL